MNKTGRLVSLDALRGFDMFWIMSGEQIVHALARATGWGWVQVMSDQLHHTVWNGFTFYDMIFPLFLFIAGASMPFSMQKAVDAAGVRHAYELPGTVKRGLYGKMLRRMVILVVLGVVVNGGLRFNGLEHTRFPSVLGRIGLAWFFAGLIYLNTGWRGQVGWFAALLVGYWGAMMWIPVPGYGAGVLTMPGSLESYVDRLLVPGRLHDGVHDPEGVLSTIPAIGTALLGVFTGSWLQGLDAGRQDAGPGSTRSAGRRGWILLGAGVVCVLIGWVWGFVFPINKRLWTSSFVLYAGGYSMVLTAVFYLVIDVAGWKKWAFPFVLIGSNSILIYIASEGMIDFGHTAGYVFGGMIGHAGMIWQPVLTAVSVTAVQLLLLYFLYRKRIFLKI